MLVKDISTVSGAAPGLVVRVGIDAAITANHHVCVREVGADGTVTTNRFLVPPTLAGLGLLRQRLSGYGQVLAVAERIIDSSGYTLDLVPHVNFTLHSGARGAPFAVPDRLWRLDTAAALATITLPTHLHWSGRSRPYRLRERRDRARVYEIVLREGTPEDLRTYVDGALLVDLWDDLALPAAIRTAWEPVIAGYGEPGR